MSQQNDQLRQARERTPSRRIPGVCMSRSELASAISAFLWETTGVRYDLDPHLVGKWERGAVRWPNDAYRFALRSILGAESDADLGFSPPIRRSVPLTPDEAERVSVAAIAPRKSDLATIDTLANVLSGLRRLEDETSAADVLPTVLEQKTLVDLLARDAPNALRAATVGLASELAQYTGWLHMPDQQWSTAGQHLDRAVVFALQIDDPLRLATALSFQAYRAILMARVRDAASFAEAAARHDSRVDSGLRAYMTLQRAEIRAHDDDRGRAARLLLDADRLIERISPEELHDSGYWYTPAVLTGHKGFVLRAMGDSAAARRAAAESLAAMPQAWRDSEWAARHRALAED